MASLHCICSNARAGLLPFSKLPCHFITIGQYLQPTPAHAPIARYVTPDEFSFYARQAKAKGFLMVASSPLTRSSYHAGDDFEEMRKNREAQLAAQ